MKLCTLSTGDAVYRYYKTIVMMFEKPRKVLSTSLLNGGYHEDLSAVFNHNADDNGAMCCISDYIGYMQGIAREAGLDPAAVSGMGTAASMDNAAIHSESYQNLTVTAIATGGVEVNGGRVGDPAEYFQPEDKDVLCKPGTINIMLVIDADLPPGILARALVTCTEAKTAALQELMAGSNYSNGLATGSGTDQTIVIANPASPLYLLSAGKHSKLGELIGAAVKKAVKEALLRQTGLSPAMQHSALRRMKRFGATEEALWQHYVSYYAAYCGGIIKPDFMDALYRTETDALLVAYTSLYVHLLDQLIWELLSPEEVVEAGNALLALAAGRFGMDPIMIAGAGLEDAVEAWITLLIHILMEELSGKPGPADAAN